MMHRLYLVICMIMCPGGVVAQETRPRPPPVIDMHLHVYPDLDPMTGEPRIPPASFDEWLRRLNATLTEHNVVKAVAFGPLEYMERITAVGADHLIPSVILPHPHGNGRLPALAQLRAEHAAGRLSAMGEILAQYHGLAPTDSSLEPYFALAEELDLPVGIHMGLAPPGAAAPKADTWYNTKYRVRLGSPLLLEDVVMCHPRLRLYVMHAGWPMLDEMIGLLWAHPQVYADLAALQYLPRAEYYAYLRRLVEAGFGERLMFGSDAEWQWPDGALVGMAAIEEAPFLTAQQKRDILYNNAVRFLRLESKATVPR